LRAYRVAMSSTRAAMLNVRRLPRRDRYTPGSTPARRCSSRSLGDWFSLAYFGIAPIPPTISVTGRSEQSDSTLAVTKSSGTRPSGKRWMALSALTNCIWAH
jgi:hypothetical protein